MLPMFPPMASPAVHPYCIHWRFAVYSRIYHPSLPTCTNTTSSQQGPSNNKSHLKTWFQRTLVFPRMQQLSESSPRHAYHCRVCHFSLTTIRKVQNKDVSVAHVPTHSPVRRPPLLHTLPFPCIYHPALPTTSSQKGRSNNKHHLQPWFQRILLFPRVHQLSASPPPPPATLATAEFAISPSLP